jgi:hypothetical protein
LLCRFWWQYLVAAGTFLFGLVFFAAGNVDSLIVDRSTGIL